MGVLPHKSYGGIAGLFIKLCRNMNIQLWADFYERLPHGGDMVQKTTLPRIIALEHVHGPCNKIAMPT
jgi:hypothetical protein